MIKSNVIMSAASSDASSVPDTGPTLSARATAILRRVYDDARTNAIPPEATKDFESFQRHYRQLEKKEHPTCVLATLRLDYLGGSNTTYTDYGTVMRSVAAWLDQEDPTFDLGEVAGPHSQVEASWSMYTIETDYFAVEDAIDKSPEGLNRFWDVDDEEGESMWNKYEAWEAKQGNARKKQRTL